MKVGTKVRVYGMVGVVTKIYKAPKGSREFQWANVRFHTGKYRGKNMNYYLSNLEELPIKLKKFSAWK